MKHRTTLKAIIVMLVFSLLVACSNGTGNSTSGKNEPEATPIVSQGATDELQTSYPLEIVDVTNTVVTIEDEPQRVITLVPSDTEIMFAVGAEEKLVGVNAFSDYPAAALELNTIGDMTINIEAVVALEPDLVLASQSMNGQYIESLRALGLTVYAADPLTYDTTIEHIETLGELVNVQQNAKAVTDEMLAVKEAITSKIADVEKPKVYLEFSPGWTVGKDTYIDNMISLVGGVNISQAYSGWYEVNGEVVVQENPNVIIYPNFGEPESSILKAVKERSGWQVIDAVQNNRIVEVSNEPLVRVGPRLADGLEELAKAVHPELFE